MSDIHCSSDENANAAEMATTQTRPITAMAIAENRQSITEMALHALIIGFLSQSLLHRQKMRTHPFSQGELELFGIHKGHRQCAHGIFDVHIPCEINAVVNENTFLVSEVPF